MLQIQGVYKFPGDSGRDFKKNQPAMQCTKSATFSGPCNDELQPTLIMHNVGPWQR